MHNDDRIRDFQTNFAERSIYLPNTPSARRFSLTDRLGDECPSVEQQYAPVFIETMSPEADWEDAPTLSYQPLQTVHSAPGALHEHSPFEVEIETAKIFPSSTNLAVNGGQYNLSLKRKSIGTTGINDGARFKKNSGNANSMLTLHRGLQIPPPHFAPSHPSSMNHFGPPPYDNGGQWSPAIRPSPSRSDLIRMELRHSLERRQATSPQNASGNNLAGINGPPRSQSGMPRLSLPASPHKYRSSDQQQRPAISPISPSGESTFHPQLQHIATKNGDCRTNSGLDTMPNISEPLHHHFAPSFLPTPTNPSTFSDPTFSMSQSEFNHLFDFNLTNNGGFDMENDATRSLVQQLLS